MQAGLSAPVTTPRGKRLRCADTAQDTACEQCFEFCLVPLQCIFEGVAPGRMPHVCPLHVLLSSSSSLSLWFLLLLLLLLPPCRDCMQQCVLVVCQACAYCSVLGPSRRSHLRPLATSQETRLVAVEKKPSAPAEDAWDDELDCADNEAEGGEEEEPEEDPETDISFMCSICTSSSQALDAIVCGW